MAILSPLPETDSQTLVVDPALTLLLDQWRAGNNEAYDTLVVNIYQQLRKMAKRYLRRECGKTGFQTTALVHEAFLRLGPCRSIEFQNRKHFFNTAGLLMRRVLVERSRQRRTMRRGGHLVCQSFQEGEEPTGDIIQQSGDLIALDQALQRLQNINARRARIVELRFFVGLTTGEIALALGISERTAKREWRSTKLWLARQINDS